MLRVYDLQRLLDAWIGPLQSAGASLKVIQEMSRLSSALDPFRESPLADFADFLQKADTCIRTGQWPTPGKPARAAKAAKASPADLLRTVASLYERAATDPALTFEEIDRIADSLKPLTVAHLKEIATQVDVVPAARPKKDTVIRDIIQAIKNRKASLGRTSYGMASAQA